MSQPQPTADDPINVAFWVRHIEAYEQASQEWLARGKKIIKRYRDERPGAAEQKRIKYNVLWANTQTLLPALYARDPKPDISRRFRDADPVGRVAADVLERSVSYFVSQDKFGQTMRQAVLDYLLPGRGTAWARYVPHMRDEALQTGGAEVAEEGAQVTDDVVAGDEADKQADTIPVIEYEEALTDYVHCDDFGHTVARTWDEVRACWRRVYLTRAELVRRFADIGATVPLDHKEKDAKGKDIEAEAKATVYELWDIHTKKAFWIHKNVETFLDERADPLGLEGFWPTPRPLFANLANDSLIPVPEYSQYQDQAVELDNLTARIDKLTKALKAAGVYDASAEGVQRLLNEGVDNQLIPVQQWALFAERGGLKGAVDFLPIRDVAEVLMRLYEARAQVKQDLYEISGMADIIRGASNPNETATAQQLKSNFATLRLSDRQTEVQRFARDLVRILTQIIANQFQLETIKLISGVQLLTGEEKAAVSQAMAAAQAAQAAQQQGGAPMAPPITPEQIAAQIGVDPEQLEDLMEAPTWEEVERLIRDRVGRCFRIDIETDSTIKADEQAEKQERTEFLTAAGSFIQQAVGAAQMEPALTPLLSRMLMFGVRAFPVGKELESTFQSTLAKLDKQAAQPREQGPNPEMAKVQAQAQADMARLQQEGQLEQQRIAADAQVRMTQAQLDAQLKDADAARTADLERYRVDAEASAKVRIAEIQAAAANDAKRYAVDNAPAAVPKPKGATA